MRSRFARKTIKVLLVFTVILIVIHLLGPGWVDSHLRQMLASHESGLRVTWDSLTLLPFSRGIRLENIEIEKKPPTAAVNNRSPLHFRLKSRFIEFRGIHILSLFKKNGLKIHSASLRDWEFTLWGNTLNTRFKLKDPRSMPLQLERISLQSGNLQWLRTSQDSGSMGISPLNARISKMEFAFPEVPPRRFQGWLEQILPGAIGPVQLGIEAASSDIHISRIRLDEDSGNISIDGFHLLPRYPRYRYARRRGYQTDRIELSIPRIRLLMVPPSTDAAASAGTGIRKLEMDNPRLDIFRDRRLARKQGTRHRKPFPQQILRRIPVSFSIPHVEIRNGNVTYAEHLEGSSTPGELRFSQIFAGISEICFGSQVPEKCEKTLFNARCLLQGSIPTEIEFGMEPHTPRFHFSGKVDSLALKTLNSLTIPMAFIRIDRGRMQELTFQFQGDHRILRGTTKARYKDLKVSLLKRRTPPKRKGLATFIMNRLLIPNNPTRRGGLRIAKVEVVREPERSFFNWLWRAILEGLKRSAGI